MRIYTQTLSMVSTSKIEEHTTSQIKLKSICAIRACQLSTFKWISSVFTEQAFHCWIEVYPVTQTQVVHIIVCITKCDVISNKLLAPSVYTLYSYLIVLTQHQNKEHTITASVVATNTDSKQYVEPWHNPKTVKTEPLWSACRKEQHTLAHKSLYVNLIHWLFAWIGRLI